MNEDLTENTDQIIDDEVDQSTEESDVSQLTEDDYNNVLSEKERLEKENAKLKRLFANAREHTKDTPKKPLQTNQPSALSRDELILFAKGLSEDEVEEAKFIADRLGVSPIEATNHQRFKLFKESKEQEDKSKKAQVSVSKRGQVVQEQKTFNTPGLTREEHKRLFEQHVLGR